MQANLTIEVSKETPQVLESFFIAFQYSDLCGSLDDRERGQHFEDYLTLQKLINWHLQQQILKQQSEHLN